MGLLGHCYKFRQFLSWLHDGLGAARGQRSRKGPCASYPTHHILFKRGTSFVIALNTFGTPRASSSCMAFWAAQNSRKRLEVSGQADRDFVRLPQAIVILWMALQPLRLAGAGLPELKEATLRSFRAYVAAAELRNQQSLQGGAFLWTEELSGDAQREALFKLKQGGVVVRQLNGKNSGTAPQITGGMIHDWQGMVFIPNAKLDEVLTLLQDYDHHASYYSPDVERAKIETHDGDHFRVFMRFRRHKVVAVVPTTEQDIRYFRDSPTRAHSRSSAIRIREVADPGTPQEREKSPGNDNGFLWQMETWWRMEERDGGVYVQNEASTLTRDIPVGFGWLIEPFVTSIPKETLEFTLGATRKAVLDQGKQ